MSTVIFSIHPQTIVLTACTKDISIYKLLQDSDIERMPENHLN